MMYPFKVLNKKKYALCFINAFLENICLYIMPVILSVFLTIPFSLKKFKWLIILILAIKILEIFFNILWNTKVEPFLEVSKKDLQIAYFKRLYNMNISRINSILNNKEKCDIFYENRPVWIQGINNDVAKVGFIDNFEEKDVFINELYERHLD